MVTEFLLFSLVLAFRFLLLLSLFIGRVSTEEKFPVVWLGSIVVG